MPAGVVNGKARHRETRVGKCPHGYANAVGFAFFGVVEGRSAHRAETEPEPAPLVADAHVLGGLAKDLAGSREACQRCKDAPRPQLTGETVADADNLGISLDFDAKLAT